MSKRPVLHFCAWLGARNSRTGSRKPRPGESMSRGTPHHVRRITTRPGENGCAYTGFYYDTARAHTVGIYHTRERGWGRSGYAFFERRRRLFARRLRRHQDAAALDPVQRLRAAVGRGRRAGLGDSRARLRRVARRDGGRWRHSGRASGFRRYVDSVADAGADGAARSGGHDELAEIALETPSGPPPAAEPAW